MGLIFRYFARKFRLQIQHAVVIQQFIKLFTRKHSIEHVLLRSRIANLTEQFINRLRSASDEAKVRLHVYVPSKDGRITATRICEIVPEWKDAHFWFCGPSRFGETLRDDLVSKGLSAEDFHMELFEMR